ncbi:MAG: hypothetical protein AB7S40_00715 [Bacteroidales bacterium]
MRRMSCRIICTLIMATTFGLLFSQESGGGSFFYEKTRELSRQQMERLAIEEFAKGNYPSFLTEWAEIGTVQEDAHGKKREVVFFVSPDYLAIGNSGDYYTLPLTPMASEEICEMSGAWLPTPKIVDMIYCAAELKLEPFNYIPRGRRNESADLLYEHSKVIQAQMKAAGRVPGTFIAGVKKDIVISSKLADSTRTHHVIIYGWHKPDGKPIQPETNVHIDSYVDYSHGTRMVKNKVLVDGVEYSYPEVLSDPVLHTLFSYDKKPLLKRGYR